MGDTTDSEIKKGSGTYCSVPQCSNYASPGISFHVFPKALGLKEAWQVALKMGKEASSTMRVCSKHFLPKDYCPTPDGIPSKRPRLYPHAVPSQNLPQRTHDKKVSSPRKHQIDERLRRSERRQNTKQNRMVEVQEPESEDTQQQEETNVNITFHVPVEECFLQVLHKSVQFNLAHEGETLVHSSEDCILADFLCAGSDEKATQANIPAGKSAEGLSPDPKANKGKINLADLRCSDEKLFTYTGIHSLDLLDGLVECVEDIAVDAPTNKKQLSVTERIILTMMKLKQNMSFSAIAPLFGISRQTCAYYFKDMCPLLACGLQVVVPWPDKDLIRINLPISFENYKACRVVLDCAETSIEKSHFLKCRVLTYSEYKKKSYLQILCWHCTFRTHNLHNPSDKCIVNQSGILDKCDYGDGIMVDKGFNLETECLERYLKLSRPPFLRQNKKLSKEDYLKTADIVRARVRVERAIQRLRQFKFLSDGLWLLVWMTF